MPRLDDDLLQILTDHVAAARGETVQLEGVDVVPLEGGFVAASVDRLDLTMIGGDGERFVAAFVRKGCPMREIKALEHVAAVPGTPAAPEVITAWSQLANPDDPAANGFISAFYPGQSLNFGDAMPGAVRLTLARLHAASLRAAPAWAWSFDVAYLDQLVAGAVTAVAASERFHASFGDWRTWLGRLEQAGAAKALFAAMAGLPRCLVHGDVHAGNILSRANGSPVLIDWGNACIAPPMLDLANMIEVDTPEWDAYLTAYEVGGGVVDRDIWRQGYWWARAATAFMYLPWTAAHTERAPVLIEQIELSVERLADFG